MRMPFKVFVFHKKGVMKSRGKMILFADADGASKFIDYERLENAILKNASSLEVNLFSFQN